jgi:phosphoribosylformylglycinamidine synthase
VPAPQLDIFRQLCERERCPFAVVGEATEEKRLVLEDPHFGNQPIDLPLEVLLGKPPRMHRAEKSLQRLLLPLSLTTSSLAPLTLADAVRRVLAHPAVADKTFLISIGDRTVGGLICRDQMVGPWQVPVADCAVTAAAFDGYTGEAMAVGERTPVAVNNAAASARLAVGEALTNLAAAQVGDLGRVNLSANWMAAPAVPGDAADLYAAVQAVGMELCPALGLTIPVGKDSMSMSTVWNDGGQRRRMTAPISLIVSAFAPCADIRLSLTPQLRYDSELTTKDTKSTKSEASRQNQDSSSEPFVSSVNFVVNTQGSDPVGETVLLLVDLGRGQNRLGGSILAQVVSQMGEATPDVDSAADLKGFWNAIQQLGREKKILAYHDRSDGGLLAAAVEMAFASHTGVDLEIPPGSEAFAALFAEELGAVLQIRESDLDDVHLVFRQHGLKACVSRLGTLNRTHLFRVTRKGRVLVEEKLSTLRAIWSDVTRRIAALRDNPACAEQEYQLKLDPADPGITPVITFGLTTKDAKNTESESVHPAAASLDTWNLGLGTSRSRPPIAILREQGVNGQVEMAAAFTRAGFRAIDVHMTDILSGRIKLADFRGLVACGGFSYGDVLGGGGGWAKSILFHERARAEFAAFFSREDTFALGVCNGCQMMSHLHSIIPGSDHWPRFVQNRSERFEARLVSVKIERSPSVLFAGMEGSVIPLATAHGEGYAEFASVEAAQHCSESGLVCARFVDNQQALALAQSRHGPAGGGEPAAEPLYTEQYPLNPNGSPHGMTAFTTTTGRVTILMPHPERVFRTVQMSWHPSDWGEDSPWMKLFYNARSWIG